METSGVAGDLRRCSLLQKNVYVNWGGGEGGFPYTRVMNNNVHLVARKKIYIDKSAPLLLMCLKRVLVTSSGQLPGEGL